MHFDMKGKITNGKVLYYIFHQAHTIYTCACSEKFIEVILSKGIGKNSSYSPPSYSHNHKTLAM